ncbi:thymocyte nuclear protein 1 [Umbelopsis sp. PMI_123]|nr:thymocyte nuclear protein 1 [Umbelopsis sp. PMI_123]
MAPSLRNRQKKDEKTNESASNLTKSTEKSKRAANSHASKSRKKAKKDEVENSAEVKKNKGDGEGTKSNGKAKAKEKTNDITNVSVHGNAKKVDMEYQHWLMKAEPDSRIVKEKDVKFSIDDLKAMPESTSQWDGVRNFEARNMMRDRMKVGHKVLFYHSNCKLPGVAGIAEIVKEGYVDYTAFDSKHPYYDPKSEESNPKWYMVDVKFVRKLNRLIPLKELQSYKELSDMVLIRRGRLSVQPVTKEEYEFILSIEDKE